MAAGHQEHHCISVLWRERWRAVMAMAAVPGESRRWRGGRQAEVGAGGAATEAEAKGLGSSLGMVRVDSRSLGYAS